GFIPAVFGSCTLVILRWRFDVVLVSGRARLFLTFPCQDGGEWNPIFFQSFADTDETGRPAVSFLVTAEVFISALIEFPESFSSLAEIVIQGLIELAGRLCYLPVKHFRRDLSLGEQRLLELRILLDGIVGGLGLLPAEVGVALIAKSRGEWN